MKQLKIRNTRRWWNWEDVLLILLVAGVLYLPGLRRIALFDRDEPRFAQAAREMILSHNFIVPRFDGVLRPDKPPIIYWLMDVAYAVLGVNGMAARLPSVVFGSLTLLLVYGMAGKRFGRATGILSALMLSVCALFFVETRLATADSTMIFFTTLAMACAWSAWDQSQIPASGGAPRLRPRAQLLYDVDGGGILNETQPTQTGAVSLWTVLVFWFAIAAGILTKGVTPIFVLSTMITLSIATGSWPVPWRQWRQLGWGEKIFALPGTVWKSIAGGDWRWWRSLRPRLGVVILIGLVLPWFIAAWIQTNGKLIEEMLLQNLVARTTSGLQSHGEPPGFYLAVVWGTFWPWSVLLVPAAFHTVRRVRGKTAIVIDPTPYQFLLAWIVPAWIIFELIVTKMVQYVLPLFIPMMILCADTLVQSWHRLTDVLAAKWFAAARWVWMGVWIVLSAGLMIATWLFLAPHQERTFLLVVPTAAALVATGFAGAIAWNRPAWPYVTVLTFGLALLLADTLSLPAIKSLQISRQAGREMRQLAGRGFHLAAAGYIEPTLVFYSGGNIRLFSSPQQLLAKVPFLIRGAPSKKILPPYCVLVDRRVLKYLRAHQVILFRRDWFNGIKMAKGRPVRITLITNVNSFRHFRPSTRK